MTARYSQPSGIQMHVQGKGISTQPRPNAPSPEERPLEAQTSASQTELIGEVWDMDDDHL